MASTQFNLHREPLTHENEDALLNAAGVPEVVHITVASPLQVLPGLTDSKLVISSPVLNPANAFIS